MMDAMETFFYGVLGLILGTAILAGIVGYVLNCINLFQMATSDSEAINVAMVVIRGLGIIFAPLGAVVGYF
jgi:hypothetical protein